jgi:hypothetical protein
LCGGQTSKSKINYRKNFKVYFDIIIGFIIDFGEGTQQGAASAPTEP